MSVQDDDQFEAGYTGTPTETTAAAKAVTPADKQVDAKAGDQAATALVATPDTKPEPDAADPIKVLMEKMESIQKGQDKAFGHIGALQQSQQKIAEQLAAAQAATKAVNDSPTQTQVKEAMSDPEEWARLKKEYPEWATATEQIIDAKVKQNGGVDQAAIDKIIADHQAVIDKRVAEEVAKATAANRQELIDSHLDSIVDGNWRKEYTSEACQKWMSEQPPEIQKLAYSNKMADAAKVLRMYQAFKQKKPAQATQKPEVSTRQKRLEAAVNPRGVGGATAANTDEDEFEAGYNGR